MSKRHLPAVTCPGRTSSRGFTLMELMVVVAIIAVFAGLALPVGIDVLRDQRSRNDAMEVVNAGRMARARSMGRGSAVLVRFGSTGGAGLQMLEIREGIERTAIGSVIPNADCRTSFPPPGTDTAPFPNDVRPDTSPANQVLQTRTVGHTVDAGGNPLNVTSGSSFQQYAPTPDTMLTVNLVDICFSPTGRTFWRVNPTAPLTPMDGFVDINLQRNITPDVAPASTDALGLVRRARFLRDGDVRFVTCDPKVSAC